MTSRRTRERLAQRLRGRGIGDERVLGAIRTVPRHLLIDEALASRAYEDTALPIGFGQTISQPYVVAAMTQALLNGVPRLHKVLEVGTGSGYQTAVLALLVDEVYSIERIEPLMKLARRRLREIGCRNAQVRLGDGTIGWPEHAPYDGIVVTAAAAEVPSALLAQLVPGGRMIAPVGGPAMQELLCVVRNGDGHSVQRLDLVNFVPLVQDGR